MKPQHFEVIAEASHMFTALSSFARNNPAVSTPETHERYRKFADELMDILRETTRNE